LLAQQRYPVLVVVPVTGTLSLGAMYPVVQPYRGGLTKPSTVLVDMIRSVDKQRVTGRLAPLPLEDLRNLDDALRAVLAL
jgi:mRNA-degrading endonuclease toxin of MazEF toxin-antitoxin module